MLLDKGGQVNVHPWLVLPLAARHRDQPRKHARHLHDRMKPLTAALGLGPNKQVVTFIQELRERMTGINRQRRQQGENFLLEIAMRPGSTVRAELTHRWDS